MASLHEVACPPHRRAQPHARADRDLPGLPDDHPRRDNRQRRSGADRERPRRGRVDGAVDRQRLHPGVRGATAHGRRAGRPHRATHLVPRRPRRLRGRQRGLRGRDLVGGAHRRACGPRRWRRGVDALLAGAHRPHVSRPRRPSSRARRGGVARREPAWPPDPSSAASSLPPSAGARSSWSTCRSPPWPRNSFAVTLQKRRDTVTHLTSPARSSPRSAWRR